MSVFLENVLKIFVIIFASLSGNLLYFRDSEFDDICCV